MLRAIEVLMFCIFLLSVPVFTLGGLYSQDVILGNMLFGVAGISALIASMLGMVRS
jgi:hypothetical protein